jgi:hypothetical protein
MSEAQWKTCDLTRKIVAENRAWFRTENGNIGRIQKGWKRHGFTNPGGETSGHEMVFWVVFHGTMERFTKQLLVFLIFSHRDLGNILI